MVEGDTTPKLVDMFTKVHGFISLAEAELLHRLALDVPMGGKVIEVGSYQARSTIALALGCKAVGATLWAIDPHPTYEQGGTHFSMADNQAYYQNIAHYEVGGVVKTVNLSSAEAFISWVEMVDLVWIDGDHQYESVRRDWYWWSMFSDVVALHDTAGYHEGVTKLVHEILESGTWEAAGTTDSITVFKRMAK